MAWGTPFRSCELCRSGARGAHQRRSESDHVAVPAVRGQLQLLYTLIYGVYVYDAGPQSGGGGPAFD